jgi:hypothetical protein
MFQGPDIMVFTRIVHDKFTREPIICFTAGIPAFCKLFDPSADSLPAYPDPTEFPEWGSRNIDIKEHSLRHSVGQDM